MRICWKSEDLVAAIESSRHEAMASFNDDNVLIEKYLVNPRHVELQVRAAVCVCVCVLLQQRTCSFEAAMPAPHVWPTVPSKIRKKKCLEQRRRRAVLAVLSHRPTDRPTTKDSQPTNQQRTNERAPVRCCCCCCCCAARRVHDTTRHAGGVRTYRTVLFVSHKRSSRTNLATPSTCSSATARYSAVIKKSSRRLRLRTCRKNCARRWATPLCRPRRPSATRAQARSSSFWTPTATTISWR